MGVVAIDRAGSPGLPVGSGASDWPRQRAAVAPASPGTCGRGPPRDGSRLAVRPRQRSRCPQPSRSDRLDARAVRERVAAAIASGDRSPSGAPGRRPRPDRPCRRGEVAVDERSRSRARQQGALPSTSSTCVELAQCRELFGGGLRKSQLPPSPPDRRSGDRTRQIAGHAVGCCASRVAAPREAGPGSDGSAMRAVGMPCVCGAKRWSGASVAGLHERLSHGPPDRRARLRALLHGSVSTS
jgi:hypothetical protein